MAMDEAMQREALRMPMPTAKHRPSVYDHPPYLNGPRHEYLIKCLMDVNPRVLSRAVDQAMKGGDTCLRNSRPPLLKLDDTSPNIFAPHVDCTRAAEAFGRRVLPNLRRDLDSEDSDDLRRALMTISDVVHDPEMVCEAVRVSLMEKLVQLMQHKDSTIRERSCAVLETLSGQAVGRDAVLAEPKSVETIKMLVYDEEATVRMRAAVTMRALTSFRMGPYDMDEGDLAPFLVDVLRWETYPDILAVHCTSLHQLLEMDPTKEACIFIGAFELLHNIMRKGYLDATGGAAEAMARLASCSYGRQVADYLGLVGSVELRLLLLANNDRIVGRVAMLVMNLTHTIAGKQTAYESALLEPLIQTASQRDVRRAQMCALQALTNLAEYAPCRAYLLERKEDLAAIKCADKDVENVHKRMLAVVRWQP